MESYEKEVSLAFDAGPSPPSPHPPHPLQVVVVSDKIRVEALRLDQEYRALSQFVEASAEKFERWERNRSDPSTAPANPLSSNDIHVPSPRSEVIEMKEFAPGSTPADNDCDTSTFSTASSTTAGGMAALPPPPLETASLESFALQAAKIDKMIARDGGKVRLDLGLRRGEKQSRGVMTRFSRHTSNPNSTIGLSQSLPADW